MSSDKYLAIDYTGNIELIKSFLVSKVMNIKIHSTNNKLLVKISEDLYDEILFFKNFILESNTNEMTQIKSVKLNKLNLFILI